MSTRIETCVHCKTEECPKEKVMKTFLINKAEGKNAEPNCPHCDGAGCRECLPNTDEESL